MKLKISSHLQLILHSWAHQLCRYCQRFHLQILLYARSFLSDFNILIVALLLTQILHLLSKTLLAKFNYHNQSLSLCLARSKSWWLFFSVISSLYHLSYFNSVILQLCQKSPYLLAILLLCRMPALLIAQPDCALNFEWTYLKVSLVILNRKSIRSSINLVPY